VIFSVDERGDDGLHLGLAQPELARGPEAEVGGHLVVAAAARVELLAEVAHAHDELALDPRMDVLVLGFHQDGGIGAPRGEDLAERRLDLTLFLRGEHARAHERLAPGDAPLHVLADELPIERQAVVEFAEEVVGLAFEPSGPDGGGHRQLAFVVAGLPVVDLLPPQHPPVDAVAAAAPPQQPPALGAAAPRPCTEASWAASAAVVLASSLRPSRARMRIGRLKRRMKPSLCLWS
jgi:hypothetical protein